MKMLKSQLKDDSSEPSAQASPDGANIENQLLSFHGGAIWPNRKVAKFCHYNKVLSSSVCTYAFLRQRES